MIRIKDQFLSKFDQDKSDKTLAAYKKFRNHTTNEVKKLRQNYFQTYFMENGKNLKKLWTGMKSILVNKMSIFFRIHKVKDRNGNLTSDASEMSNILSEFFIIVGNDITKSIDYNL